MTIVCQPYTKILTVFLGVAWLFGEARFIYSSFNLICSPICNSLTGAKYNAFQSSVSKNVLKSLIFSWKKFLLFLMINKLKVSYHNT